MSAKAGKFKADIKKLKPNDRTFAEGIFRHHCPRDRRDRQISLEATKKAVDECKRKIAIPPSAVARLVEFFNDVSGGRATVDLDGFLAILSRMIHDSDAARRHRNRQLHGSTNVQDLKRVASTMGRNIGSFLGVLEDESKDASLEIFRERERRMSQRRVNEKRQERKVPNTRRSVRQSFKKGALGLLHLPGSSLYEADNFEDPEEQPLNTELDVMGENGIAIPSSRVPPPLPGGDTPRHASMDLSAPPLPSRDKTAPRLRGAEDDNDFVPPVPRRRASAAQYLPDGELPLSMISTVDLAPALPPLSMTSTVDIAPALPLRNDKPPPLPDRISLTEKSPIRSPRSNGDGPPLPGRDNKSTALPARYAASPAGHGEQPVLSSEKDGYQPALPSREAKLARDDSVSSGSLLVPALPAKGAKFQPDSTAPALPARDAKPPGSGSDTPAHSGYDFIEDRDEALAYYRRRSTKERVGTIRKQKKKTNGPSSAKEEDTAWKNARTKTMKHRIQQKFLKKKADTMPVYSPWMIYLITYAQIIVLVIQVYRGNWGPIKFIPKLVKTNISTLTTTTGYEITNSYQSVNFWIGAKDIALIQNGATFSPCMRRDNTINQRYRRIQDIDMRSRSGCCVKAVATINKAIYTTERKCTMLYGPGSTFYAMSCTDLRNRLVIANDHAACCTGFIGQCQMLTLADCASASGRFYRNQTCLQVNCLQGVCGFGGLDASPTAPYTPAKPNQWWRFFTAMFLHHGIIHVVVVGAVQVYVGRKIERSAGWLRLALIYFVSGMMSNVAAGYVNPYSIITGGSGALCGLVAVLFVELFNMWSLVKDPRNECINLLLFLTMVFVVGTLPHLNNWAHLAGFVFGLLMAVLLLPYVSFGKWAVRRKRILVVVSTLLLFSFILCLILLFQLIQNTDFCPNCDKFNCIDFTPKLCAHFRPPPPSDAVQFSSRENVYYATTT